MKKDLTYETVTNLTVGYKNLSPKEIYCESYKGIDLFKIYSLHEDGQGFMICSSTTHLPPVVAYSLENRFFSPNGAEIKEQEKFLKEMAKVALDNRSHQVTFKAKFAELNRFRLVPTDSKVSQSIPPLMHTEWHQDRPFNNKVPGLAGCVAAAAAQIMKYHSWPPTGVGIIPEYQSLNTTMPAIDIEGFIYAWDKMTDAGTGDQEQENAVADLMLHVGCAIKMQYMGSASSSLMSDVPSALTTHYRYDEDITFGSLTPLVSETTFSSEELVSMVSFDLENGKPVQFGGAGHSIVCDGKDENDFFHMNYGGGGYRDGYYSLFLNFNCQRIITDIKPEQSLSIKWSRFNCSEQMILGEEFIVEVLIDSYSDASFIGDLTLILADVSGAIIIPLGASQAVHIVRGENVKVQFTFTVPTNLTCNARQLGLLANSDSLKWGGKRVSGPIGINNFVPVKIIRAEAKDDIWLGASLEESLTFNRNQFTPVSVVFKNTGRDFHGAAALCLVDKNDNVMYEVARVDSLALASNEEILLEFSAVCPEEVITGDVYTMKVFCSSNESLPVNAYPILIGQDEEIINFSMVTIKSTVPYLDELSLPLNPNFPQHISPRTKTPINFDLYAKNGLLGPSTIRLVLIDDFGVITEIGSQSFSLSWETDETKHFSITPEIRRALPYGAYDIGIIVYKALTDTEGLVIGDTGVNNPLRIIVDPAPQAPFVHLIESLPITLSVVAGQKFNLSSKLNLFNKDDDFDYFGTVVAYIILPNSDRIKVGEIIEQIVTIKEPELLNMDCQLPDDMQEGEYELYLEAWDRFYPDLPSRLLGKNESINDVVKIIVVANSGELA